MNQTNLTDAETPKIAGSHPVSGSADHHSHEDEHENPLNWREINRVLFTAAAAAAIWFLGGARNPYITAVGVVCAIVGGFPIFHEAYENITQRRMTMELSMAIAIVAALAIREIFTALIITLFVLVAEILEGLTVGRGRRAIQHLIELLPNTATVRRSGTWIDVGIQEVASAMMVLVRPGARIPVDGKVVGGHSFVDQAPITGESMPVEKQSGTIVYAGTINQSGSSGSPRRAPGPRHNLWQNHRGRGDRGEVTSANSRHRGPTGGLSGLFGAGRRGAHVSADAQHSFDDFGDHRGRSLWNRGRDAAGRFWARSAGQRKRAPSSKAGYIWKSFGKWTPYCSIRRGR